MTFIPKKKAVVIGINYIETEGIALRGCANDAKLMALTLISHFDFNASDILFLTDSEPDRGYDTLIDSNETVSFYDNWPRDEIPPAKHHDSRIYPNKRNILTAINWLTRDAEAGDILVFYFAGHGVQVDVLTSYEGEGYDEALLPADSTLYLASNGSDLDEYNVLLCSELKELLLCVPSETQLNIILDCNGGQTILDPAGNINGLWYIKGIVTKGIWPFLSATSKVKRAQYKSSVFRNEKMVHRLVRPRYVPCVQVGSTLNLKDPTLQSTQYVSLSCKGYCFSAAPWGEIAAEASLPLLSVSRKTQLSSSCNNSISTTGESKLGVIEIPISRGGAYNIVHGVFTWSFCKAISDIATGVLQQGRPRNELSFKTIMARIREYITCLKSSILPNLDQTPELTIHSGGAGTVSEYFCTPFGGDKSVCFDYNYYFKMTDNCISHLKESQNFLTPQEAYNSMLQSTKHDTLLFQSVNINCQSMKLHSKNSSSCISRQNSPPTFRKDEELDRNYRTNFNTDMLHSVQFKTLKSNEVPIQNSSDTFKEVLLPPSSVDLVPPTATLFDHPIHRNEDYTAHYQQDQLSKYQYEKEQEQNIINQAYLNYNSNNYLKNSNIQNLYSGYNNYSRDNSDKFTDSEYINFNKFNPYLTFVDQKSSFDKSNEIKNELKPIKGMLLSNPLKNNLYNKEFNPSFTFNQQKQNSNFVRPATASLLTRNINYSLNHQYIDQTQNSIPTIAMPVVPPTPPLSSYRSYNTNQIQNITYPPLKFQSININNHLIAPIRSLPNSNDFYQVSQTRHVTGPNSNSIYNERSKYEYSLQKPSEYPNFFPSNQSNSFYPNSFINYSVPTQPLNIYGNM